MRALGNFFNHVPAAPKNPERGRNWKFEWSSLKLFRLLKRRFLKFTVLLLLLLCVEQLKKPPWNLKTVSQLIVELAF